MHNTPTTLSDKSMHLKLVEIFYQPRTARKTNSDQQLVRKDIDANEHVRLSNID